MRGKVSGWGLVLLAALAVGVPGAGGRSLDIGTVLVQVVGGGSVTEASINCGAGSRDCFQAYVSGTAIVLTANDKPNWTFDVWELCPTPVADKCTVPLDGTIYALTENASGSAGRTRPARSR